MKRYFVLLTLTPLAMLIVAELTAWMLWTGHPLTSFWYVPWTTLEYWSWQWSFHNYVFTRFLDWIATKQGQWPRSVDIYQWFQDSGNWHFWFKIYRGFLFSAVATGILWVGTIAAFAWFCWRLRIRIGGTRVPPQAENQQTLQAGASQSGKTSLELQTLADIRKRGDPVIVTDPSGEITKHFCGQGGRRDYILDIGDARSINWSPFAELAAGVNADLLAQKMIGEGKGPEKDWRGYASGILRDVMLSLVKLGTCTNADLCRAILADNRTIKELVKGRPSEIHFASGNEKYLASVRSILSTYTAPLFGLDPEAGSHSFSIARHIQGLQHADGRGKYIWRWLFLKTRGGDLSDSQKQMLSCWMSIAVNSALSLPVNRKRRIWFVMEEAGNLGTITGFASIVTQGAKYGVCVIALIQSVSQFEDLYGKERAQTILSCFNNVVVCRLADPQTAEYFERHFGKKEVIEWRRSEGSQGGHSSSGRSEQIRVRPKFYSHELMELRGKCITWIVGGHPRRRSVPKPNLPIVSEAFVPRPERHQQPPSPPATLVPDVEEPRTVAVPNGPQWKE